MDSSLRLAFAGLALFAAGCGGTKPVAADLACESGSYLLEDGRTLGLVPRDDGGLRYVFLSGETGATHPIADGVFASEKDAAGGYVRLFVGDCENQSIEIWLADGSRAKGARLQTVIKETVFDGVDGKRAGRLVLPAAGKAKAIVVSVHGSERWSGRTGERLQVLMPAFGIGVFAYDKRGTGASEGKYTQDFEMLSGDAIAAAEEARRLYGRDVKVGYWGGSQGGWVAPLAALKSGADFVIAAYGMAEGPLAEDREEVLLDLRRAGYGDEEMAAAVEITEATARVMESDFKEGFEELAAVKKKYKGAAWLKVIDAEFTNDFMSTPNWLIRIIGPFFDVGTSWEYDPRPTLEAIKVPHLWILAGDDTEAPHEKTLEILRDIQRNRENLSVVVFPNTEHGIYEYVIDKNGAPQPVRFAPAYYPLIRDFILTGEAPAEAPGAVIYRPAAANDAVDR